MQLRTIGEISIFFFYNIEPNLKGYISIVSEDDDGKIWRGG